MEVIVVGKTIRDYVASVLSPLTEKLIPFHPHLTSYAFPLIRIVIAIVLLVILFFRDTIFHITITNLYVDIIVLCIVGFLAGVLIFNILVSILELCYVYKNRKKAKHHAPNCSIDQTIGMDINEIMALVIENDIIEIKISVNNVLITIGASSDYTLTDGRFFDKEYYIEDAVYKTPEDFRKKLENYANEGQVLVFEIDGIKTRPLKKHNRRDKQ